LNALTQSGTRKSEKSAEVITVTGNESDLLDDNFLARKAKKKFITQATIINLVDIARAEGDLNRVKAYWNTYHCQNRIISSYDKFYGNYCKNRFCTTCCGNRKADIINKYYPVIKNWKEPYFVTLTIKSPPSTQLRKYVKGMKTNLNKIIARNKKRHQRGKGIKILGIKSLECNFNPIPKTYNPHFHIIVPNKETAELLKKEWIKQNRPTKAAAYRYKYVSPKRQDIKKIEDLDHQLVEVIKYGAKIFTAPDVKNKNSGVPPMVYIKALDVIYSAFKDIRLFDRFSFNLPDEIKVKPTSKQLTTCDRWEYSPEKKDWINKATGELLTRFLPSAELELLHTEQINTTLY
jgi:hypothetical protein